MTIYRLIVSTVILLSVHEQWGVITGLNFTSGISVTFPISFSTACRFCVASINQISNSDSASKLHTASVNTFTNSSSAIFHMYNGVDNDSNAKLEWVAIGY